MTKILKGSIMAVAALAALPCHASSLGAESTGTVNITVIIPPIGAAVHAQEEGATGLWSILNGNRGLMIDAAVSLPTEGDLEVQLLSSEASQLQIRSYTGQFSRSGTLIGSPSQLGRAKLTLPLNDLSVWTYNPLNEHSKLYVIGTV
jgi:hypothetical protein